jgi:hypothetical protein
MPHREETGATLLLHLLQQQPAEAAAAEILFQRAETAAPAAEVAETTTGLKASALSGKVTMGDVLFFSRFLAEEQEGAEEGLGLSRTMERQGQEHRPTGQGKVVPA